MIPTIRRLFVLTSLLSLCIAIQSQSAIEISAILSKGSSVPAVTVKAECNPNIDPVAGLKLRILFKDSIAIQSIFVRPAETGPWSQIAPSVHRENNSFEFLCIAPTFTRSHAKKKDTIFVAEFALDSAKSAKLNTSDLFQSITISDAIGFSGHPISKVMSRILFPKSGPDDTIPLKTERNDSILYRLQTLSFKLAGATPVICRITTAEGKPVKTVLSERLGAGIHDAQ